MKNPSDALSVIRKLETWFRMTDHTGGSKQATSICPVKYPESVDVCPATFTESVDACPAKYRTKTNSNSTKFKMALGKLQIKKTATMMKRIRLWRISSDWNRTKFCEKYFLMSTAYTGLTKKYLELLNTFNVHSKLSK